jgi:hypothetical protein
MEIIAAFNEVGTYRGAAAMCDCDAKHGSSRTYPTGVDGSPEKLAVWSQIGTLQGSDASSTDQFGVSVGLSRGTAFVGAPGHGGGSEYVFADSGRGWRQEAELRGSDTLPGDQFGTDVSVSATTLVVGAPGRDGGRAYVFTQQGGAWEQVAELQGSDTSPGDQSGASVAISGGTVIVSAPGRDNTAGRAYIFTTSGAHWIQAQEILGSDTGAFDLVGAAVAVSGDTAVVGASGRRSGRLYVFRRTQSGWVQSAELAPVPVTSYLVGTFSDYFALSGNTLLVTTPGENTAAPHLSPAVVLDQTASGWTTPYSLMPRAARPNAGFATSVALSGANALVGGAPGALAYLFQRSGRGWELSTELHGSPPDGITTAVAISDSTALVALPGSVAVFRA